MSHEVPVSEVIRAARVHFGDQPMSMAGLRKFLQFEYGLSNSKAKTLAAAGIALLRYRGELCERAGAVTIYFFR